MLRWIAAVAVLALFCRVGAAEQIKGKVVKVDAAKNQLTLSVDAKDKDFTVKKNAKVYTLGRKMMEMSITLAEVKEGAQVTVNVEKEGDKEVLTFVKVEQQQPKKKPKKKK